MHLWLLIPARYSVSSVDKVVHAKIHAMVLNHFKVRNRDARSCKGLNTNEYLQTLIIYWETVLHRLMQHIDFKTRHLVGRHQEYI